MKLKGLLAAVIIISVFCLAGCASGSVIDSDEPQGGDPMLTQNINLKSIEVEAQGEKTVIRLNFISGSRLSGVTETKLSGVPVYEISMLDIPYRIKVDMPVDYFDCFEYGNEVFNGGIVYGAFPCKTKDQNSVYIQLSQNVSLITKEEGAVLTLELTPIAENNKSEYYVGIDAFEEYKDGKIPSDLKLTPSLCDNKSDIIMISDAFKDENSAREFAESAANQLTKGGTVHNSLVFELKGSELPPAVSPPETAEVIQSNAVIEIGGDFNKLPILIENGRYLCETPEGDIIFSRLVTPAIDEDSEYVIKEELYKISPGIHEEKIDVGDFYGIEQAAVSPDGRYLAVLDAGISDKLLYVYDMEEDVLRNLGEEGFGANTSSFVWDSQKPIIYAMTGYNTLQLNKYDLSKPDNNAITSVEEKPGAESKIVLINGSIYFADPDASENGEIYRVDLENPQREVVTEGKGFAVSPGGYYLALLESNQIDEMTINYGLGLIDLKSPGETKHIIDEVDSYAFGIDNDTIYFMTQDDEGINGQYQYAFKKYTVSTGEVSLLGYTKTNMFIPTDEVGKVYIIDYIMRGNEGIYITYIFDENSI